MNKPFPVKAKRLRSANVRQARKRNSQTAHRHRKARGTDKPLGKSATLKHHVGMQVAHFNEEKAMQACAYFLERAPGQRMAYIKALKLLYFFERETLKQTGFPVLNDTLFIMKHGPVLSNTMDLMTEEPMPGENSIWREHIAKDGWDLILKNVPKFDLLSEEDLKNLEALWAQFGHMGQWKVVDFADALPENIRIPRGRLPLSLAKVFQELGFSQETAFQQEAEIVAHLQ